MHAFIVPYSLSTQSVVSGRYLSHGRSQHASWKASVMEQTLRKFSCFFALLKCESLRMRLGEIGEPEYINAVIVNTVYCLY